MSHEVAQEERLHLWEGRSPARPCAALCWLLCWPLLFTSRRDLESRERPHGGQSQGRGPQQAALLPEGSCPSSQASPSSLPCEFAPFFLSINAYA